MLGRSLGDIYAEIAIKHGKLTSGIAASKKEIKSLSQFTDKEVQFIEQQLSSIGRTMSVAVTLPIALAGRQMIKTFADFEQSMANTASVMGASAAEMEKLRDVAAKMGADTRVSASGAADALYYLGSAGYSATQAVAALDGVLSLALATGSDLAFTSSTITATLSQFNLAADQAGRVSNVFAAAISGSQATMDKLAYSMRYVGPIASGFGMSLEQSTAALMALYNAGFRGEQAGTILRAALTRLSDPAGDAKEALKSLGLTVQDVNPQGKSFADLIQVIGSRTQDTTTIIKLFGQEAGSGMAQLVRGGDEAIRKYEDLITGTNKAVEMQKTQNATMANAFDELSSKVEGLAIKLVDNVEPAIIAVTNAIAGAVKAVTDLPTGIQVFITGLMGIAAVTGPMILVTAQMMKIKAAIQALNLALAANPMIGWVMVAGLAASAIAAVVAQAKETQEAYEKSAEGIKAARFETERLTKRYDELMGQTSLTVKENEELDTIVKQLKVLYPELSTAYDENTRSMRLNREELEKLNVERAKEERAAIEERRKLINAQITKLNQSIRDTEKSISGDLRVWAAENANIFGSIDKALAAAAKNPSIASNAVIESKRDAVRGYEEDVQRLTVELGKLELREREVNAIIAQGASQVADIATPPVPPSDASANASAIKTWQQWWKDITDVSVGGGEEAGRRAGESYLASLAARMKAASSISAMAGKPLSLADMWEQERDEISDVLNELMSINPAEIDIPFEFWDNSVQVLIGRLRELRDMLGEISGDSGGGIDLTGLEKWDEYYSKLNQIERAERIYGDALDGNAERIKAAQDMIDLLISQGYGPESVAIQKLIGDMKEWGYEIDETKRKRDELFSTVSKLSGFASSISDAVRSGIENGMQEADVDAIRGEIESTMQSLFSAVGGPIGEAFWNIGKVLRDVWHSLGNAIFGSVEPSQEFLDSLDAIGKESGAAMVDRMMEEYRTSLPDQLIEASQSMVGSIVQGFRSGDWDSLGTIIEDNIRSMVIDKVLTMGAFADQMEAAVQSLFKNVTKSGAELQSEKKGEIEYAREQQKAYLDAYNAYVGLQNKIKDNQNQIDAMSGWDKFWSHEDDKLQQEIDAMKLKQAEFKAGYNKYITWEKKIIELKKELAKINPELAGSLSLKDITPEKIQELVDKFGDKIRPILEALGLETGKDFGDYFVGTLDGALAEAAWNGDFDSFKTAFGNQLKQALITEALEASAYQQQIDAIVAAITTAGENGFTETEIDDLLGMYRGVFDTISDAVGEYADIFNRLGISGGELDVKVESRGTVISKMTGDDRNYLSDAIREIGTTLQDAIANSPLMQLQTADIAQMTIQQMIVNNLNYYHTGNIQITAADGADLRTVISDIVREAMN